MSDPLNVVDLVQYKNLFVSRKQWQKMAKNFL